LFANDQQNLPEMSSDQQPDQNALNRLLSQYQQALSSAQQYQLPMGAPGPAAASSTSPSVPQGLGSLLASYHQQSNATNTTPPGHATQGLPAHQVMQQAPGNGAQGLQPQVQQQQPNAEISQHILASAQLLSAINPGFAAAALARAFNINPQQQNPYQPQPQPQQPYPQQQPQLQQQPQAPQLQQQNQPAVGVLFHV
jgi:hypothetical protein